MKEALLFHRLAGKKVRCILCSHRCLINAGERGLCLVRVNSEGTLYTQAYGKSSSHGVDAVENKPLFHFMPGSMTYSVATTGCNFKCWFCQRWQMPACAMCMKTTRPSKAATRIAQTAPPPWC